jgi:hypothetical protein
MKQNLQIRTLKTAALIAICCTLLSQPSFAAGRINNDSTEKTNPGEDEPAKKATSKTRSFMSRNNSAVKIYPDIIKREMHVVAKDNNAGKEISFFVFDLQGTLVQNYKMKAKDHYRISGLKKGTYIYRVFSGDEETASGKFEIR